MKIPALLVAAACLSLPACQAPDRVALPAEGAVGPYSAAVSSGDLCFVSGRIGKKRDGSFAEEAESCIDSVEGELSRLGLTLADVLSATVFLVDMERYQEFNGIYSRRFSDPYPARACIAVRELPVGARVEIQVVARRR